MPRPNKIFSDLDLSFNKHPVTGDIGAKFNEQAVKNSIKNLVLTRHYERPFRSEIGSNIDNMLFELATPALAAILKQEIINLIRNFEPRVDQLEVEVSFSPDNNYILVKIIFTIVMTTSPIVLEFTLDRTR